MSRNEEIAQEFSGMKKIPAFEMENGDVLYLQYNKETNQIEVGGVTNSGLIPEHRFDYDQDLSLDANLQGIYEQLSEMPEYQAEVERKAKWVEIDQGDDVQVKEDPRFEEAAGYLQIEPNYLKEMSEDFPSVYTPDMFRFVEDKDDLYIDKDYEKVLGKDFDWSYWEEETVLPLSPDQVDEYDWWVECGRMNGYQREHAFDIDTRGQEQFWNDIKEELDLELDVQEEQEELNSEKDLQMKAAPKQECEFTSVAPYPKVRQLAHGLKDGKQESILQAADMMASNIKEMAAGKQCVLVPVPNHHGRAEYTKTLAEELTQRTGIPTWDIVTVRPHMPLHYAKQNDLKPEGIYLKLNLSKQVPQQYTPIIVDNVLDTGYTAGSVAKAIGHSDTMLAVLGHTKNYLTNKNYQFNQIATKMEKKQVETKTKTKKQAKPTLDTPLAVYQRLKSKHPDALILMRNGDFYRSLNEDAQKLSDTLRIPAQKPKLKKDGELIAEFPHHTLDTYLPKLIRAGYRVAIVDMQEPSKKQTTNKTKKQTQTDTMEKKTEKKKTKTKEAKVDKTEVKAETKKNDKAVEQSADTKVHKPREPQMVTVNGEKVTHGHAFQSNQDPNKWYFTARIDGQQLRPQLMKWQDVEAYQKHETTIEALMQNYYPTKLQKKVTPEEYKADNKLSDGRIIDKMVVYKEHDASREDAGKYRIYTQVGDEKMSRTMSYEDLNAFFDRVTTPAKLVEKNFGEQLHLASFYKQFQLPENADIKSVNLSKGADRQYYVSANLGERGETSKAMLSWHDRQALFKAKTVTKEQLAARYLTPEINEMMSQKNVVKQSAGIKI